MNKRLVHAFLWRIVLTVLVAVVYGAILSLYRMIESPLSGVATAKTLDDSATSYAIAKFIREGGVPAAITWTALLAFAVVWISLIWSYLRTIKTTNQSNNPS